MDTGTKLKALREKRRLSQEELAHKVGVTQATIGNWEHGKSIKHEFIPKLADALDVPSEFLFEEKQVKIVNNTDNKDNSLNAFEITIKAPHKLFEDLNNKIDFLITKFDQSQNK